MARRVGHTANKGSGNDNTQFLLGHCIKEGACDFIYAELLCKKMFLSPYMSAENQVNKSLDKFSKRNVLDKQ
jgi:hypothetical protein